MVDSELTFTYDQLKALGLFEQYVTIACVSNHVGEDLVGNAKWTGVHLRDVLAMAGVRPEATQIVGRSVDGFTVGFPTEWAMDPSRDPMIAIGMNDALLPAEHGYPARLIVPGLFGYVSATKWLAEIELTTLGGVRRLLGAARLVEGGADPHPVAHRRAPHRGAACRPGPVPVAGVAWAPDRGMTKVEISVDHGRLAAGDAVGRRFRRRPGSSGGSTGTADGGVARLEVRATDGTGEVQTDQVTPPAPDGARGHHHVDVNVA